MQPLLYFDIRIRAATMQEAAGSACPVMARLLRCLHGYFAQHPDTFAVAFPRLRMGAVRHIGNVLRIFAATAECIEQLEEWLGKNNRVAPYIKKGAIQIVEEKNIIEWMEYRRYLIPSRSSRLLDCRDYRIKSSEEVPYLRIASASGDAFSMHICAIQSAKSESCTPTSYGLSGEHRFSLPVLK
jgi:hypothetical protein